MIREIVIPTERTYILHIPESFIGKKIELLAFEISDQANQSPSLKEAEEKTKKLRRLNQSLEGYKADLSAFKFSREEANNYE